MSDTSFASLSPTLLARKGGARPAMRPQNGAPGKVDGAAAAANLEDLGWNDMGDADSASVAPEQNAQPQAQLQPQTRGEVVSIDAAKPVEAPAPVAHPIHETIERLGASLATSDIAPNLSAANMGAKAKTRGKRAAFTLRLDAERHLKLRLACTVKSRSAQQIVTDALDALLAEMPEIDLLARQVPRD